MRHIGYYFLFLLLVASISHAQPSGGPYGPIDQRYEIPKAAHVYFVAPDGKTDAAGTTLEQPTTLESAIDRAIPATRSSCVEAFIELVGLS